MEKDKEELLEDEETTEEVEKQEELKETSPKSNVSSGFVDAIKNYLDSYAEQDEAFKSQYEKPNKNLTECCNYICNQVRQMGVQGLDDTEVYKLARDYYVDEVSKDDCKSMQGKVVVNHSIELTEEEKQKARIEAIKKFEEECLQEERKKREEEAKKQAKAEEKARKQEEVRIRKEEEKKKAEEEKKQKELEEAKNKGGMEQTSIFDFGI